MSENEPNKPLDYRPGDEDRREKFHRRDLIGGIIMGMILVGMGGCFLTMINVPYVQQGGRVIRQDFTVASVMFFLTCLLGAALVIGKRPKMRWTVMGILIGISVTSLLEGLCFLTQ